MEESNPEKSISEEVNSDKNATKPALSESIARGFGVLALCVIVTILFFAFGLNEFRIFPQHPHGMPAGLFIGWIVAWGVGWVMMRLHVFLKTRHDSAYPKRAGIWIAWSLGILIFILLSGF